MSSNVTKRKSKDKLNKMVTLAKSDISNFVKIRMLQVSPEWSSLITRKLIMETMVFMDGFGSCLKEFIKAPYNEDEIRNFLKEEAFQFMYRKIEQMIEHSK